MSATKTIELCSNTEWLGYASLVDDYSPEREAMARDWFDAAARAIEALGFRVVPAPGQRGTFHGWNGANLFKRKGSGAGSFDDISDAEWSAVEGACLKAADRTVAESVD